MLHSDQLEFMAQIASRSAHYDNELNTRRIGSSVLVNLGGLYQVPDSPWSFRLQVDNLFDEAVTTAIASNGIYTESAPLNAWFSVNYSLK